MHQDVPPPYDTHDALHHLDRRGRHRHDWVREHREYIDAWEQQKDLIVASPPILPMMDYYDPYLQWYKSITR